MGDREQKRARLESLTVAMQKNIDDAATQIEDVSAAITVSVSTIDSIQADIDALVAISNRTAIQNLELRSLRKDIALWRALLASQRLTRSLIRNDVVISRFGLFLDGTRVRQTDMAGGE